jgi:hypothetical protein
MYRRCCVAFLILWQLCENETKRHVHPVPKVLSRFAPPTSEKPLNSMHYAKPRTQMLLFR